MQNMRQYEWLEAPPLDLSSRQVRDEELVGIMDRMAVSGSKIFTLKDYNMVFYRIDRDTEMNETVSDEGGCESNGIRRAPLFITWFILAVFGLRRRAANRVN